MKRRWLFTLLIVMVLIFVPSCQNTEPEEADNTESTSTEQSVEAYNEESSEKEDDSYQKEEVPAEFDENGNPTGEYAQYLWEQQQMEEAKKSMVEDAMREYYEDMYNDDHSGGFPLD